MTRNHRDFKMCNKVKVLLVTLKYGVTLQLSQVFFFLYGCISSTVNMEAFSSGHYLRVTYVSLLITSCAHVHVCAWLCDCINKNGIKKAEKKIPLYF